MLAIYKLVYRIFFFRFFFIYKNLHIEPFNTVHKMFCFGFDSSYHAQLSNENLHYINLDSILLTVQMSLPINYLPYWKVYQQNTKYDCGIRNRQPLSRYTATALHSYIIINYSNPRTSYRLSLSNQIWMPNAYCLESSKCLLDFGCCELSQVIFLKLRKKERTACKDEQIHKMTTIFA